MGFSSTILLLALSLFLGIMLCLSLGQSIGRRRLDKDSEGGRSGVAAAVGAIFALMGLLIAFSFSGAASRFDARRSLVTSEANAISTAWLMLDLLPKQARAEAQVSFRAYVDARLAAYQALPDVERTFALLAEATVHGDELWDRVVVEAESGGPTRARCSPRSLRCSTSRTSAGKPH